MKDIYGGDYAALGLPGDLVASSFGKTVKSSEDPTEGATVGKYMLFEILKFKKSKLIKEPYMLRSSSSVSVFSVLWLEPRNHVVIMR